MTYVYDNRFFEYIEIGSRRSAQIVVGLLSPVLKPASLLDIGCGRGVWVAEWARTAALDASGVDGAYVDRRHLRIPEETFVSQDLSQEFDLQRKFDLVQSLEVAEHIPAGSASTFIENIVRHGDIVLFSAATPGQGGAFHVNEQPHDYWREYFRTHGYEPFDFLRPLLSDEKTVEPWYRYNTILYANEAGQKRLPREVLATKVPAGRQIHQTAPLSWRLRNAIFRGLGNGASHNLALIKHALVRASFTILPPRSGNQASD